MKPDEFEIDPETQAEIDFLLERAFETQAENRVRFDGEVLQLLGKLVVEYNSLESDWKHAFAVLFREGSDPRPAARKAFRMRSFKDVFCKTSKLMWKKHRSLFPAYRKIVLDANRIRIRRNVMIHSTWFVSTDPDKPFVRFKPDARESEEELDTKTLSDFVGRLKECSLQAYNFFRENLDGYDRLWAELYDMDAFPNRGFKILRISA